MTYDYDTKTNFYLYMIPDRLDMFCKTKFLSKNTLCRQLGIHSGLFKTMSVSNKQLWKH